MKTSSVRKYQYHDVRFTGMSQCHCISVALEANECIGPMSALEVLHRSACGCRRTFSREVAQAQELHCMRQAQAT